MTFARWRYRLVRAWRQYRCRVHGGHCWALVLRPDRIALRCLVCHRRTPGWCLHLPPPNTHTMPPYQAFITKRFYDARSRRH